MKKIIKLFAAIIFLGIIFYGYLYFNYAAPILMYHSLDKSRTENFAAVSEETFHRQMVFIKNRKYKVIALVDYCRMLRNKENTPRNLVIITFDDGYKDNLKAIEILKEMGFPATIFITVNNIGKPGYLSQGDIRYILNKTKVTLGSHTLNHPDLPKLLQNNLKKEISGSKKSLEEKFAVKIETITYPGGVFDEKTLKEAQEAKYLCACTTNRGFSRKLNLFALRRIKATNNDNDFTFWAKLSGFYNIFKKPKKPY